MAGDCRHKSAPECSGASQDSNLGFPTGTASGLRIPLAGLELAFVFAVDPNCQSYP